MNPHKDFVFDTFLNLIFYVFHIGFWPGPEGDVENHTNGAQGLFSIPPSESGSF